MFALPSAMTLLVLAGAPALAEAPVPQAPAAPIVAAAPAVPVAPAAPAAPAVLAEAPVPPPAPAVDLRGRLLLGDWSGAEKPVSLDLDRVRTRDALAQLATQAGWSIAFKDRPGGRVDMTVSQVPADQVLLTILREEGLVARREGGLITIEEADGELAAGGADGEERGDQQRISIGGSVRVPAGETVREAVSVGGSVEVDGTVLKDAVSVFGKVKVGPKAVVHGNVVSVGGSVEIDPSATVHGDRVAVGSFTGLLPFTRGDAPVVAEVAEKPSVLSKAAGVGRDALHAALFFVLGLMLLALFPERVKVVHRELQRAPGPSAVIGLLGLMAVPPLALLLLVTVVGIPVAVLVLPVVLAAGMLLGFTSLALTLGARFPTRDPRRSQVLALGFGALIFFLVDLVPVLGSLALGVLGLFAFGAVLRTRFGSGPRNDANFAPSPY